MKKVILVISLMILSLSCYAWQTVLSTTSYGTTSRFLEAGTYYVVTQGYASWTSPWDYTNNVWSGYAVSQNGNTIVEDESRTQIPNHIPTYNFYKKFVEFEITCSGLYQVTMGSIEAWAVNISSQSNKLYYDGSASPGNPAD